MNAASDNPFLKAVIANPDDDLTRLVYADWLDENGQPERAEFVRVQVALASGVPDIDRRRQLEDRQRELLVAHDAEWVRELADVLDLPAGRWGGWVFRRGFVEYFHLPAATLMQHGAALAELTPARELYLNPTMPGDLPLLCQCPWLARVRDLYLWSQRGDYQMDEAEVRALIGSRYTGGLRKFESSLTEGVIRNAWLMAQYTTWHQKIRRRK